MTLVREGEREKYNDGDDKSQVGLMIERKEEGKKRENGKSKRADDGNGRKHRNPSRERKIEVQDWVKDGKRNLREELGQFREGES